MALGPSVLSRSYLRSLGPVFTALEHPIVSADSSVHRGPSASANKTSLPCGTATPVVNGNNHAQATAAQTASASTSPDGGETLEGFPFLQSLLKRKPGDCYNLLHLDSSLHGGSNPEQATSKENLQLLNENLEDCLKVFAKHGYFGGSNVTREHPLHIYLHPPVYTCEQADRLSQKDMKGCHMKNLFLRDKKKNLYLISAVVDTEIKLNELTLNGMAKKASLSFASSERLFETMHLIPGSVTPFGLMYDFPVGRQLLAEREGRSENGEYKPQITYFLDENALQYDYLGFHPNACHATVDMHRKDFVEFIEKVCGHKVNILGAA